MGTNDNGRIPSYTTHPGKVLGLELKERGIKQADFARRIGVAAPNLNALIKEARRMTPEIAASLEKEMGISNEFWMRLQARYDYVSRRLAERSEMEKKEQSLASRVDLRQLYKRLGIDADSAEERIGALIEATSMTLDGIAEMECATSGYFKRSPEAKTDPRAMRTWLLLASLAARGYKDPLPPYAEGGALRAAAVIARAANEGRITPERIKDFLATQGIGFAHVEKLEHAPVDAYSTAEHANPVVVATFRCNDLDKLVFDVLHELGHLHLHLGRSKAFISMEGTDYKDSPMEREADAFARDTLISPSDWREIMGAAPKSLALPAIVSAIARKAKELGVGRTIAVARYKRDTQQYAFRGFRSPKIRP